MTKRCTCEEVYDFNNYVCAEELLPDERHELGCALMPDMTGWLCYPSEDGCVWANPVDNTYILLEIVATDYVCKVLRADLDAEEQAA
jgi:hypothetical protein